MSERIPGFRGISDEAVRAKTGKDWVEWLKILDEFGAKELGHTNTAKKLETEFSLSPWWAQAVTIRHEWERGLRQ